MTYITVALVSFIGGAVVGGVGVWLYAKKALTALQNAATGALKKGV